MAPTNSRKNYKKKYKQKKGGELICKKFGVNGILKLILKGIFRALFKITLENNLRGKKIALKEMLRVCPEGYVLFSPPSGCQ